MTPTERHELDDSRFLRRLATVLTMDPADPHRVHLWRELHPHLESDELAAFDLRVEDAKFAEYVRSGRVVARRRLLDRLQVVAALLCALAFGLYIGFAL